VSADRSRAIGARRLERRAGMRGRDTAPGTVACHTSIAAGTGIAAMHERRDNDALNANLRAMCTDLLSEIATLNAQVQRIDRAIGALADDDPMTAQRDTLPAIGALTASALWASVGDVQRFKSGRAFPNWLGFTPKENSSGMTRQLGRMSKRGRSGVSRAMARAAARPRYSHCTRESHDVQAAHTAIKQGEYDRRKPRFCGDECTGPAFVLQRSTTAKPLT